MAARLQIEVPKLTVADLEEFLKACKKHGVKSERKVCVNANPLAVSLAVDIVVRKIVLPRDESALKKPHPMKHAKRAKK